MKCKKLCSTLLIAALSSIGASAQWTLVWSDEFNGSSINPANWTYDTGGGGWGNSELEYYTSRPENATVSNGQLLIIGKKESYGGSNYTSARLKTQGLQSWTYGRIEARMKLPQGKGLWPAFWMLGNSISSVGWPKCGEIDIMEHIDLESIIHGTMHWDNNGHASYGGSTSSDVAQYHLYAVEWNADSIKWFVDGNPRYLVGNISNNINGTDEFHAPFHILLNMAIGGNWPGNPDATTLFPDTLFVDYVRVYKKAVASGNLFCNQQQPPAMDGVEDNSWQPVYKDTLQHLVYGTVSSGPDLFATCRSAWDSSALYLLATVKDDKLRNDSGTQTWNDDAVEVFLDGNNEKATSYDSNDRQYIFRWNDSRVYEYHNGSLKAVNPAGVTLAQKNISGGYQMEMRIAWSAIGVAPYAGKKMGFDVHVDDDDNGGARDAKLAWAATSDLSSQNPSVFGTIQLDSTACGSYSFARISPASGVFPESMKVYPNPVSDRLLISYPSEREDQIEILVMDLLSNVVKKMQAPVAAGENTLELDTKSLRNGTYLISILSSASPVTRKIVVMNKD